MKKILLSLLLLAGISVTTRAQTATVIVDNPSPNAVYVAPNGTIAVPVYLESSFRGNYPAANKTSWYRMYDGDWWRVTYVDNGPWVTLVYNTRGDNYRVSLPFLKNGVPADVVNAVLNRFSSIYDITETTGSNYQTQYIVRTMDGADGMVKSWRVNANGTDVPE